VLRYIEIALFGVFIILFLNRAWESSFATRYPPLFIVAVAATFAFGLMLPKIIEYLKTNLKL